MKIVIEIPDTPALDAMPDEDVARFVEAALGEHYRSEQTGKEINLAGARAEVIDSAWTRKPDRSFLSWLKAHTTRVDPVGDLARAAAMDPNTPHGRASKGQWRDYLGGAPNLARALDDAWAEFLRALD